MHKLRSTLALAILGLLVGGVLAALTTPGDGSGDGGEIDLIAHSAEAVADAGSFRASFAMGFDLPATPGLPGGDMTMEGEGEFDDERPAGRITMRMGMAGETIEMEVLLVETMAYLKMGGFPGAEQFPTPWVSFDFAAVPGMSELLGGNLGTNDPSQFVDYLRGADGATEVGREDVRGVPTTHYRGVVNFEDALASLDDEDRDALRNSLAALGNDIDFGSFEFPVDVWIDDQGLPRRMSMAMDMGGLADEIPSGTTMTFSMELYDFGIPVDVQAPPAHEVTDLTDMIGAGLS